MSSTRWGGNSADLRWLQGWSSLTKGEGGGGTFKLCGCKLTIFIHVRVLSCYGFLGDPLRFWWNIILVDKEKHTKTCRPIVSLKNVPHIFLGHIYDFSRFWNAHLICGEKPSSGNLNPRWLIQVLSIAKLYQKLCSSLLFIVKLETHQNSRFIWQ